MNTEVHCSDSVARYVNTNIALTVDLSRVYLLCIYIHFQFIGLCNAVPTFTICTVKLIKQEKCADMS